MTPLKALVRLCKTNYSPPCILNKNDKLYYNYRIILPDFQQKFLPITKNNTKTPKKNPNA